MSHRLDGTRRIALRLMLASLMPLFGACASVAAEPSFPKHPVKIIVQTAAGSSIDVAARILAEHLSRKWGQQAFVFNQPGAGGAVAARALASAPADGETLLFAASSIFVALPLLQPAQAASIDAFVPVAFVGEQPMAVAVAADQPAKTFAELLATMRATKGGLNCAVSTRGGLSHLSAESLKATAGVDMNFIHYPGTAQALSDVIGGRVPMVVDSLSAFVGPVAGKQIRILAVASTQRLKKMPEIPTAAETLPGFEATAWLALVAPPGTPAAITQQIGRDVDAILANASVVARLEEVGTFARPITASELPNFIKAQREKWLPVVQKYGVAQ
ncbi:tripartite tricarboxylate transporter substrate binding protein [Microbacteriaceae bacterium K1510]|nr:tripartite tricarboxylate transporter substrate binding protein [Microbacteriaceae bacterium K1510]